MATPPRKIVFVCTGNICRSATAEHLLKHWAKERGLDLEVSSCGIAAESWYTVPEAARRLLVAEGVPAFEHKARLATPAALKAADLILVMAHNHYDHIAERFPELLPRTRLFLEQAGFGEADVEDPMGRPDAVFAAAMADIKKGLTALLSRGFVDP